MCNEKRDFSLLRPFDLETAKVGEEICFYDDGHRAKYFGESDQDKRDICIQWLETKHSVIEGKFAMLERDSFRMAPLCWVRTSVEDDTLKPVYKGDVLYQPGDNRTFKITGYEEKGGGLGKPCLTYGGTREYVEKFTCTPPNEKRKVSLLGFIHCSTKEVILREEHNRFYNKEFWNRSPQLDTTIEIEE